MIVSQLKCGSCNGRLQRLVPAALCLARVQICLWHTDRFFPPTSSFSSFLSCSPIWSTAVIESHSLGSTSLWRGQIRGDKTDSPSHSSLDLPCKLFHTPKLAKWPWWGKYQLSIIDYQDFLHIHLRAPLSSLINISQNVVREEHRRSRY